MASELDYAYLAGLVDGEGSIGCWHSRDEYYTVGMSVAMTHRPTVEWLQQTFGGYFHAERVKAGYKASFRWKPSADQMRDILPRIVVHMKTKKEQAEIAIALLGLRRRHSMIGESTFNTGKAQAELRNRLAVLNKRGT